MTTTEKTIAYAGVGLILAFLFWIFGKKKAAQQTIEVLVVPVVPESPAPIDIGPVPSPANPYIGKEEVPYLDYGFTGGGGGGSGGGGASGQV